MTTSVIVSYSDDNDKKHPILLVGKKSEITQKMTVINAYEGKDAKALFDILSNTKK